MPNDKDLIKSAQKQHEKNIEFANQCEKRLREINKDIHAIEEEIKKEIEEHQKETNRELLEKSFTTVAMGLGVLACVFTGGIAPLAILIAAGAVNVGAGYLKIDNYIKSDTTKLGSDHKLLINAALVTSSFKRLKELTIPILVAAGVAAVALGPVAIPLAAVSFVSGVISLGASITAYQRGSKDFAAKAALAGNTLNLVATGVTLGVVIATSIVGVALLANPVGAGLLAGALFVAAAIKIAPTIHKWATGNTETNKKVDKLQSLKDKKAGTELELSTVKKKIKDAEVLSNQADKIEEEAEKLDTKKQQKIGATIKTKRSEADLRAMKRIEDEITHRLVPERKDEEDKAVDTTPETDGLKETKTPENNKEEGKEKEKEEKGEKDDDDKSHFKP